MFGGFFHQKVAFIYERRSSQKIKTFSYPEPLKRYHVLIYDVLRRRRVLRKADVSVRRASLKDVGRSKAEGVLGQAETSEARLKNRRRISSSSALNTPFLTNIRFDKHSCFRGMNYTYSFNSFETLVSGSKAF
jgi:hypothetical protein